MCIRDSIYSGNEDNATNTVKQCEEYLKSINVEYVEKTAASSNDVETATNALIAEGAEAIFVPNDSIIQDGVSKLTEKMCIRDRSVSDDPVQQELYKKYFPNGGGSIFTFEIKGEDVYKRQVIQ